MHYACYGGHDKIVAFLLQKGADIEAKTSISRTGLHLACIKEHVGVVKILLLNEADVNCQDDDGCTPLHYAATYGYEEVIHALLMKKHKINFKLKSYQGMTAADSSLNGKIFKMLDVSSEEENYSRTMLGDTMRRSSRADHVEKLLLMTMELHKHHSAGSTQSSESSRGLEKKKNKFEKMGNINRISIENGEDSKLNLNSFEILEVLGKGSFGEVFLVRKKG